MTDNKQYPELPTYFMLVQESFRDEVYLYTADQMRAYVDADRAMRAAPAPAAQGDALPREDFAWMVVQEACETEPADEDDPECIRILRRDLKSAVLAAFLRREAAQPKRTAPASQDANKFDLGQRVHKIRGSHWKGRVVGTYSTSLTPEGYAVESETEHGSVQIYPAGALELCTIDAARAKQEGK